MNEQPSAAFQTDFVLITTEPVRSLLVLEWRRQITLQERKIGFGKALDLTREMSLLYWLIDDLQLSIITPEEKEWVLSEFQGEASQTSLQKLAVVTPDYYPSLVANTEFTEKGKQGYQAKGQIRHEVFIDHESALNWLLSEEAMEE
ncbi:hypothetical protein ACD591_04925 [Rufibacter glacialis]|uniref:STAS/SEC14 domain-containing protein n=1 Tax=Rufibacter glacialis TaxID=1259555 RepID=A0A5M8QF83_9BACT|nr:hypothetical protein [Rufibacter glacialis]KAA6434695.1 hypothetical protein FOE74_10980 [Rufibacter glacialis]GGK71679.1 hypothetical protein GCM10011405_19850 [Rufibacter glacialis]